MIRLTLSLFLLLIGFLPSTLHAQRAAVKVVKGQVLDSITGNPLPGITITFEATGRGAGKIKTVVTDANGNFKMKLPDRYFWDMKIEAPGYQSIRINTINGYPKRIPITVRLKK